MSLVLPLNEDQRDCLQELTNVAIGAAAESLAGLTHHFVNLPIPLIRFVDTGQLLSSFQEIEVAAPSSLIKQHCSVGQLDFETLVLVSEENINQLAKCMCKEDDSNLSLNCNQDVIAESLFNTITGAYFDRLSEMFEQSVVKGRIDVVGRHLVPNSIDMHAIINTEKTVAVEIYYHTEGHPFNCHLMILFSESAVSVLAGSLDRLLH